MVQQSIIASKAFQSSFSATEMASKSLTPSIIADDGRYVFIENLDFFRTVDLALIFGFFGLFQKATKSARYTYKPCKLALFRHTYLNISFADPK